jgi:hypothetical protein
MWEQFKAIILGEPDISELQTSKVEAREFVRVDFRLWPGQNALIETTFRQRLTTALKQFDPNYTDWMVVVAYRATDLVQQNVSI